MEIERLKKLQNEVSNMVFIALSKLTGKNARASVVKFGKDLQALIDETIACQWVSVQDRLPEERRAVLVWDSLYENKYTMYWEEGQWFLFGGSAEENGR